MGAFDILVFLGALILSLDKTSIGRGVWERSYGISLIGDEFKKIKQVESVCGWRFVSSVPFRVDVAPLLIVTVTGLRRVEYVFTVFPAGSNPSCVFPAKSYHDTVFATRAADHQGLIWSQDARGKSCHFRIHWNDVCDVCDVW